MPYCVRIILCSALLAAAAVPRVSAAGWRDDRERLRGLVENKVKLDVGRRLNPAEAAGRLNLPYPVPEPAQSMEEVKKAAAAAARRDLDGEYPPEQLDQYRANAEEKYALWSVGDRVSFVIRGGRGPNTKVEGRLRHVGPLRVQVDNRWIAREDISPTILARLDADRHKEAVETAVRRKAMTRQLARERLFEERYPQHGKRLMKEANYVNWKGQWMPAKELFQKALEYRRKTIADEVRPEIEREIFEKNGYVAREGEWVPKNLLGRLKKGRFDGGKGEGGSLDGFFQGVK